MYRALTGCQSPLRTAPASSVPSAPHGMLGVSPTEKGARWDRQRVPEVPVTWLLSAEAGFPGTPAALPSPGHFSIPVPHHPPHQGTPHPPLTAAPGVSHQGLALHLRLTINMLSEIPVCQEKIIINV